MKLPPLTGVVACFSRKEWAEAPFDPQVGAYAGQVHVLRPVAIDCPFCRAALHEWQAHNFGRILAITKRDPDGWPTEGLLEPVPATHRVLACFECMQIFTQPRELLRS